MISEPFSAQPPDPVNPALPAGRGRAPEAMAGLAKGLAILEAFTPARPLLSIAEAAAEANITRAAARRCLLTMTEQGYLAHDGKWFRPLPRLLRLGFAYLRADPLVQLAQAVLASVRDAAGESVSLAILEDREVVFIARAMVARIVSSRVVVGARLPAHGSATGRVLLAALPAASLAAHSLSSAQQAGVAQARAAGYGISDEELEPDLRAIAVPVCDASGRVVAAMSVSTSAARMEIADMVTQFLPLLRRGAAALGAALATP